LLQQANYNKIGAGAPGREKQCGKFEKNLINSCQSTQSDIELDIELGYNDNRLKLCNEAILAIKQHEEYTLSEGGQRCCSRIEREDIEIPLAGAFFPAQWRRS
jgi:hypothetical protein